MADHLHPRLELARLPTPIIPLESLSREFGVNLFVKRDDLTGAALSGNKVRKLEYLLAGALEAEADVVLTCGAAQSNHCRATAVAARRLGLDVELFLRGLAEADETRGNLFLGGLMAATLHHLSDEDYRRRDDLMRERAEELAGLGRQAWIIPEGGSNALGALGYVRCMEEIARQAHAQNLGFDVIVCAVGSGGTLAGLAAGAERHGFQGRILGVPVCRDHLPLLERVNAILEELREDMLPDLKAHVPEEALLLGHAGLGYGRATDEELARIKDVAVMTGLILDPVYTNKAFEGLLRIIREGIAPPESSVLLLHTGGIFGLFPFAERLAHLDVH